jgi:hypothetical protein
VLILLWLHYIFFGVIFAVLARDAWRYNVRRIMALREDAKTQVGPVGMLRDLVLCCNTVLSSVHRVWLAATCGAVLQQVAASCATLPCRDDSLFCIPDRAFEPLRPPDRAWAHECLARGAHVVWHAEGRLARVRQGAGRAAVCVCCAATVLNAALAWLGLSLAVVHVCRTVLVSLYHVALCMSVQWCVLDSLTARAWRRRVTLSGARGVAARLPEGRGHARQ